MPPDGSAEKSIRSVFVTGSGTDIGKTYFCCRLVESIGTRLSIRCIKPIVTGFDPTSAETSDTALLLRAQGLTVDPERIEATSPWRYRAALSSDMASVREGKPVPFDELVEFCRPPDGIDLNLIEGIGGVMAPIDGRHTVLDWIAALDTAVVLVVGSYLGSLSHALTAMDALSRRSRAPQAIIMSESLSEPAATEESAASLERHCRGIPLEILPRDDAAAAAAVTARIQRQLDPE